MEHINKNIDQLFAKAKNAEVTLSVDAVKAGLVGTSVLGLFAFKSLFTNLKFMSIMLGSIGTVVTAIVVATTLNTNKISEPEFNSNTAFTTIGNEKEFEEEYQEEKPEVNDGKESNDIEIEQIEEAETVILAEAENISIDDEIDVTAVDMSLAVVNSPGEFHSIIVNVPVDVELFAGDECKTKLLQDEMEDILELSINDGVLTIDIKDGKEKEFKRLNKDYGVIEVELWMTNLNSIMINSDAAVHSDEDIKSDDLEILVNGKGDVYLYDVSPDNYKIKINGSGDVTLKGENKGGSGEIDILGSGDVCIKYLKSNDVDVTIMGSGDVLLGEIQNLKVSISGSGDVGYQGEPKIEESVTGSGEVYRNSCK